MSGASAAEHEVLDRIERTRRARPRLTDTVVTLAHGAGGKASRTLVDALFLPAFANPLLAPLEDQATLCFGGARLAFSTDSFVVSPLFFPGGSIGDLAVNGTVNDLAMAGARPLYLAAGFILEEGFPIESLTRVVADMAKAATAAGVAVVTGDTKVVQRGKGDGCYITTTGIGVIERSVELGAGGIRSGDRVLVSGPVGDHGTTVLLARGELDLDADLASDTAALTDLVGALLDSAPGTRALRDATRGGVATVLNEWARSANAAIVVDEEAVPVRPQVRGACEILGIDPLYVACEGRFLAAVPAEQAPAALAALRARAGGAEAAIIGEVRDDPPAMVLLRTGFGGTRVLDMLIGDPLPRIC
ncbi:MAG: hydrogenase expression/formation protein HypE [Mycobacteriales bacterium]